MDTIQQFLRQQNLLTPDFFVVGGASKVMQFFSLLLLLFYLENRIHFLFLSVVGQVRTNLRISLNYENILAWTTAAVDNTRVIGAVPLVMDMLNLRSVRKLVIRNRYSSDICTHY